MKQIRTSLIAIAVACLTYAGAARASLTEVVTPVWHSPTATDLVKSATMAGESGVDDRGCLGASVRRYSGEFRTTGADEVGGVDLSDGAVIRMPPPPGSLQLVLSAVLSAGAWQLTRSMKQLHVGVPDWYHSGGPVQVCHATPLDLAGGDLIPCIFETPHTAAPVRSQCFEGEISPVLLQLQDVLRNVGQRAPPITTK
ncbi:MAG: hypothetical protein HS101_19440 [Planctomycetia bacterium]|jgi:hypothetical protein|nr:hypothetical protein [Planctomycetia bacterium]MCC7315599.1 hypothetical protein [Planctomycetota bacterium]OQY97576.1 MAG: hypothetical protein B6D36_18485 [Planctomycetes bacterium UTPLA1]